MISTLSEQRHWNLGQLVVGVDEAGRGALAGPVAAAAVIFDPNRIPVGLNDSKLLNPIRRLELASEIKQVALSWSVAFIGNVRIDTVNILQATFDAMHTAIDDCTLNVSIHKPLHCLIDGNRFREHSLAHTAIVKGDTSSASIAAASILAKTTRDAWMLEADTMYPVYGFVRPKGYGTIQHRSAIAMYGSCDIHRHSFLKNILLPQMDNRT